MRLFFSSYFKILLGKILLGTVLVSTAAFAEMPGPVQFENGNNIDIEQLSGSITYYCRDNMGVNYTRHWRCDADLITPGTHDYLISLTPIDADKVTLTATREDGSTRSKDSKYNSKKSTSSSRFNLLISTLTQRPLLKVGNNKVEYKFTKGKTTVEEGMFQSKVTITGQKQCRHRTAFANSESQCQNQNIGCDNYFYLENNCQY
jgi:hypothetical protein